MDYRIHTPSQLAAAFRSRRKIHGLTQVEIGRQGGLFPKTISAMETHPETSSIESLFKLLAALDLELVLSPKEKEPQAMNKEEW